MGMHSDPELGSLVREGAQVRLRTHIPANRSAFQRWYADEEIAHLLRHDQEPLNAIQSRGYFDTLILPLSARGLCYAIHETVSERLIGTSALTDIMRTATTESAHFRIVIGEKELWGRGFGTEATRLVMAEAFETHDLSEVRLEVFRHNPRALATYERVGFQVKSEHVEYVRRKNLELQVVEMVLHRDAFAQSTAPPLVASATGMPEQEEAASDPERQRGSDDPNQGERNDNA